MTQHASLSPDKWLRFSPEKQVLMISNEMNRASRLLSKADADSRGLAYERVLRLVDLSVEVAEKRTLRRELLRWRDLIGELYVASDGNPEAHAAALRILLQLTPGSAAQIPFL
ncbi:MAG: hypothetical protein GY906_08100 [bacterium]|nr:hypothetical protein [bacterium]